MDEESEGREATELAWSHRAGMTEPWLQRTQAVWSQSVDLPLYHSFYLARWVFFFFFNPSIVLGMFLVCNKCLLLNKGTSQISLLWWDIFETLIAFFSPLITSPPSTPQYHCLKGGRGRWKVEIMKAFGLRCSKPQALGGKDTVSRLRI